MACILVEYLDSCVQMKKDKEGCGAGGDWAVRVAARPAERPEGAADEEVYVQKRVSLIFYMMDEGVSQLQNRTSSC